MAELAGSRVIAKRKLASVYSWPQINEGVFGQRRECLQRGEHLLGRAFEQAATAGAEERVAAEDRTVTRIGDVSGGMPRYVEDPELEPEFRKRARIAARESLDARRHALTRRTESSRAGLGDEPCDAADVVGVMMRCEDCRKAEPVRGEGRKYGRSVAGIHDGNRARVGATANHPDVVVLEGRNRADVEHARV